MPVTLKDLIAAANAAVEKIDVAAAQALIDEGGWVACLQVPRCGRRSSCRQGAPVMEAWYAGAGVD